MNDTDPSKSLQFLAIAITIRGKPSHSIDLICEYVAQLQAQRGFELEINCAVGNLAICESGFELTSTLVTSEMFLAPICHHVIFEATKQKSVRA